MKCPEDRLKREQNLLLYKHNNKIDKPPHKDAARVMSKLFGIQFAFWKWRQCCGSIDLDSLLKPKIVRRMPSSHTENVDSLDSALSKLNVK
jgi:hypothetical protein